eukprot:9759126-Heterocapsa_arctica.AAC.1
MGCRVCCHRQRPPLDIEPLKPNKDIEPLNPGEVQGQAAVVLVETEGIARSSRSSRKRIGRTPDWILAHWATVQEDEDRAAADLAH